MNNYQKNPIYPVVLFSCILKQVKPADEVKSIKWHLNINIWSLNLNLGFKPTSFNLLLVALAQSTAYFHVTFMHHIVALHWLWSFYVCQYLSPFSGRSSDDEFDDTDEEFYYLQKCEASKTPLFILIQSHSLAPALFYCIRTTMIHLLHAAVVEPLFLCMTYHWHSK